MLDQVVEQIENKLGITIQSQFPVSGGDINFVYGLITESGIKLFVKYNQDKEHGGIISSEAVGLDLLCQAGVTIPSILYQSTLPDISFLCMSYIDQGSKMKVSQNLAEQLAMLHIVKASEYGLESDNFIGALNQKNTFQDNFMDFYVNCRIQPQLDLATENGMLTDVDIGGFYKNVEAIIPNEQPCLIHGDLWNGNFISDSSGKVYFIDPSVAYSHREFDIGMMLLFGGFEKEVFEIYNEIYPMEQGWQDRMDLFQLYYLLVHLNLFGRSYEKSVREIFSKY